MLYYVGSDRHSLLDREDAKWQCLSLSEDDNAENSVHREDGRLIYVSYYCDDDMCWKLRKIV